MDHELSFDMWLLMYKVLNVYGFDRYVGTFVTDLSRSSFIDTANSTLDITDIQKGFYVHAPEADNWAVFELDQSFAIEKIDAKDVPPLYRGLALIIS